MCTIPMAYDLTKLCNLSEPLPILDSRILNRSSVIALKSPLCARSFFARSIATVCILSVLGGLAGCSGSVPAPKEFVTYNSTDGRFSCDYPKDWEAAGGGKADKPISWAKFTAGNAEIRVDTDFAGSLYGDMAKAGSAMSGDEEAPAAKVHPLGARSMKQEFGEKYEEREAKPFQSKGFGEGRKSVFIAPGSLGSKIYGYRATLLSGDRRITIIATCNATNWQALKPAFDTVIASLRHGGS
jgi:hypothetical protein